MGPYKPLRNWVDEFIPYYMEMSWELIDPSTHAQVTGTKESSDATPGDPGPMLTAIQTWDHNLRFKCHGGESFRCVFGGS